MGEHRWSAGGGALNGFLAAVALALSPATYAQSASLHGEGDVRGAEVERWTPYIREASARFGIPEEWIRRVIGAESGGRIMLNGRPVTSRAGAMGLMQLMPGTWAEMRAMHRLGPDPHGPRDNILAGTAYLRAMYDRFGYPGLFAAYNAGPQRYAENLATGRRLPTETLAYVAAVGRIPSGRSAAPAKQFRKSGVFVALGTDRPDDADTSLPRPEAPSLFVRLGAANVERN